jgi:hypothetical protein
MNIIFWRRNGEYIPRNNKNDKCDKRNS